MTELGFRHELRHPHVFLPDYTLRTLGHSIDDEFTERYTGKERQGEIEDIVTIMSNAPEQIQALQRIELNSRVMARKPVIRGTRIPVHLLVRLMGRGRSEAMLLADYPSLQPDDLRAALLYAAQVLSNDTIMLLAAPR